MSNSVAEDKIARVTDILEQIQHLNTLIDFQKENQADASTLRQYEFMRKKFVEELNEIFLLFGITVQPNDTAV